MVLSAVTLVSLHAAAASRDIPKPLTNHPGNIFLADETVSITLPAGFHGDLQLFDYEGHPVAAHSRVTNTVNLGNLPIGFYRLRKTGGATQDWVSLGVIAPLKAPTPDRSPISVDAAMAWLVKPEQRAAAASLCALAGVNWVRDRLTWQEMEPQRGQYAEHTRYDLTAEIQSAARLKILQVNHSSPSWTGTDSHKRFPPDLRDVFRFHRAMAQRWQGKVQAFEPWNEADIPMFGGHTGAEMASLQKAAYFGIKLGNSNAIAGLNVLATHRASTLEDLAENEVQAYCDTFNFHHYEPFEQYPKLYADFRARSGGKPLWVTECARPVQWAGDASLKEPTDASLRQQAERVVKTFALSLAQGSSQTFYFILTHYVEGQTQFGLLRPDLTPRPGFLSLAATGRFLADARPRGRVSSTNQNLQAYVFQTRMDGRFRDVLVAWTLTNEITLNFEGKVPSDVCDHLGRSRSAIGSVLKVNPSPLFAIFPTGVGWKLTPPPDAPEELDTTPCPLVLQARWPSNSVRLDASAYAIPTATLETAPIFLYNFGAAKARGSLSVSAPAGWKVEFPREVEIEPGDRHELPLKFQAPEHANRTETLKILGDFGTGGKTVLSLRLIPATSRSPGARAPQ